MPPTDPPPPRETRSGKGGKAGTSADDDDDSTGVPVDAEASADSAQALATALNQNISHQRELHTTLGKALTVLLDRPAPAPHQALDHDAFGPVCGCPGGVSSLVTPVPGVHGF